MNPVKLSINISGKLAEALQEVADFRGNTIPRTVADMISEAYYIHKERIQGHQILIKRGSEYVEVLPPGSYPHRK